MKTIEEAVAGFSDAYFNVDGMSDIGSNGIDTIFAYTDREMDLPSVWEGYKVEQKQKTVGQIIAALITSLFNPP